MVVAADTQELHSGVTTRFEISGPAGAPVVVALGGISADANVCGSSTDPNAGWWSDVAGEGRPIDTRSVRVLGIDFLEPEARDDGRPSRIVTTHDQADALAGVIDALELAPLHAVVGASYGGMVGLAFAERYPELLERLVVIGAAHRSHPLTTAWRVIQRRTVELGLECGRPHDALVLARELAMTTYRSRLEFAARFETAPVHTTDNDAVFPVEGYLRHHGERFASRFTPARFLALSLSSDLHEVIPARITTPTTVVAEEGDLIVPREQSEELARTLGGPTRFVELRSLHGHDAFLTEPRRLGAILQNALFTTSLASLT